MTGNISNNGDMRIHSSYEKKIQKSTNISNIPRTIGGTTPKGQIITNPIAYLNIPNVEIPQDPRVIDSMARLEIVSSFPDR